MFFQVSLSQELLLEPKDMGKHVKQRVNDRLKEIVEGKMVREGCYVLSVIQLLTIDLGRVNNFHASAVYTAWYRALVFRPFPGQVVDCTVSICNSIGLSCVLPMEDMMTIHLHHTSLPDMHYENEMWSSSDSSTQIRVGCALRVFLTSVKFNDKKFQGVGTIAKPFLGVVMLMEDTAFDASEEPPHKRIHLY